MNYCRQWIRTSQFDYEKIVIEFAAKFRRDNHNDDIIK